MVEDDQHCTSLSKLLIIECGQWGYSQQFEVSLPYDYQNREIDLTQTLTSILCKSININYISTVQPSQFKLQIFLYNSNSGYFVYEGMYPFKQAFLLGEQYIPKSQISIKIREIHEHCQVNNENITINEVRKRISHRTIRQTLQKVADWRQFAVKNPKMSLEWAAKQIDIPKKTLDDYYYQIKLGELYGFPFEQHYNSNIGVLRRYVRQNHIKKKSSDKKIQILDKVTQDILLTNKNHHQ